MPGLHSARNLATAPTPLLKFQQTSSVDQPGTYLKRCPVWQHTCRTATPPLVVFLPSLVKSCRWTSPDSWTCSCGFKATLAILLQQSGHDLTMMTRTLHNCRGQDFPYPWLLVLEPEVAYKLHWYALEVIFNRESGPGHSWGQSPTTTACCITIPCIHTGIVQTRTARIPCVYTGILVCARLCDADSRSGAPSTTLTPEEKRRHLCFFDDPKLECRSQSNCLCALVSVQGTRA